jgi:phosphatidylinositol glycan class H protein
MFMQRLHPLQTNPEFSILRSASFHEYRVENWHLARDGSGSVVRNVSSWSWKYSLLPVIISVLWPKVLIFLLLTSIGASKTLSIRLDLYSAL